MESRRLKRMLELKQRIEQARKGEVVLARDELDSAQLALQAAQAEQRARVAALGEESELSVSELLDRARFVVLAGEQLGAASEELAVRHRELAQREEERVVATRDVRTFEILNERDREQQRIAQKSAEQRAADDINGARRGKS